MATTECCICANNETELFLDEKSGQPAAIMREFRCCQRVICPICLDKQPRFEGYCPYCQDTGSLIRSTDGTYSLGISPLRTASERSTTAISKYKYTNSRDPEKVEDDAPDVLHFVDPTNDTVALLSIRYGVPAAVLRKANAIYADHLLAARKTILIPGQYYKGGVSLSPQPVQGEEVDMKKSKIRRWMVTCKVADYDVAILYLETAKYDLDAAVKTFQQDEAWEREHPLNGKGKGKGMKMPGMRQFR